MSADSPWPPFNFRELPLSTDARAQLAGIYQSVCATSIVSKSRLGLLAKFIGKHVFDRHHGTYIPLSDTVQLRGKLPTYSEQWFADDDGIPPLPLSTPYFGNSLLIPDGYGAIGFRVEDAPSPSSRAANVGFVVATLEVDCTCIEELEQCLSWTRGEEPPISKVHAALCRFKDYRGYTAVFTGNKSIHFHFAFSTTHLLNAPHTLRSDERRKGSDQTSALLHNVHDIVFDRVCDLFVAKLTPPQSPDNKMRSLTQWKRTPWAIREINEDDKVILGLPVGTKIPQIVLREQLLLRASKGSEEYCIPSGFSLAHPVTRTKREPSDKSPIISNSQALSGMAQEYCRQEWGDWPKLSRIYKDGGEWVLNFHNHERDRKPSTYVRGEFRMLSLVGKHPHDDHKFFLPDGMSAQEFGDHLAIRAGLIKRPSPPSRTDKSESRPTGPTKQLIKTPCSLLEKLKRESAIPFFERIAGKAKFSFSRPFVTDNLNDIKIEIRGRLANAISLVDPMRPRVSIIKSGEGIGKTTVLKRILATEGSDDDEFRGIRDQHSAFAFRSHDQAAAKAEEFRQSGDTTVQIRSFREQYKIACESENVSPLNLDEEGPSSMYQAIKKKQPKIYARLEEARNALWKHKYEFRCPTTLLTMTHAMAMHCHQSVATRIWHHPDFDPKLSFSDQMHLRSGLRLNNIVFDDFETDDVINVLPEVIYEIIASQQRKYSNWRNQPHHERLKIYKELKKDGVRIEGNFGEFDALMRMDLENLRPIEVDYDAIPFGCDNGDAGIYKTYHGKRYYVGEKEWLFSSPSDLIFLTTEGLTSEAVHRIFSTRKRHQLFLDLEKIDAIYPIKIPVRFEQQAKADRKVGPQISALAERLLGQSDESILIADGIKFDSDRVMSFQKMKGRNGLEDKDISIISTFLAPPKYAELNVIGQFLGLPNVIELFYQDQINQAVGRNRGFRQSNNRETMTEVICTRRLWKAVLSKLQNQGGRVQLYEDDGGI